MVGIKYACIEDVGRRRRKQMAESVISHGEVSASCGQAYQISSLVILYIDLMGRRARITVVGCQDGRQKVVWGMPLAEELK